MSKRSVLTLLWCLLVALTICCGSQSDNDNGGGNLFTSTSTSSSLLKGQVDIEVLLNENMGGSYITAGLVKNNSDKLYSFHTQILYYDSHGKVIGEQGSIVQDLYPGVEEAFFVLTAEDWSHAAKADINITNIIKSEKTTITPDFEFSNLSVYHHTYGTRVLGEVTNHDELQYSIGILGLVLDDKGHMVMANADAISDLRPGETRMFAVDVLGEESDATDGRVYLESIIEVKPAKEAPNITFSDLSMTYNSDVGWTSVQCNITNHDSRGYRSVRLLIGVYEGGKLVMLAERSLMGIQAGETIAFNQSTLEGDYTGKELKIQIDSLAPVE